MPVRGRTVTRKAYFAITTSGYVMHAMADHRTLQPQINDYAAWVRFPAERLTTVAMY